MTEFTERYKQLSDKDLLAILADASSYQPIAVETAKKELETRNLSENQIALLGTEVAREKQQKVNAKQKQSEETEKLKNDFFALFKNVNPFAPQLELHEKQIRFMCWFFAVISIYTLYSSFHSIIFLVKAYLDGTFDAFSVLYLVDIIVLLLGTILFWKRKTVGWIFIVFYCTIGVSTFISSIIYEIVNPIPEYIILNENLVPQNNIGNYLLYLIFFVSNMYVLLKANVKKVFQINNTIAYITIGLAIAIESVIWIALFLN